MSHEHLNLDFLSLRVLKLAYQGIGIELVIALFNIFEAIFLVDLSTSRADELKIFGEVGEVGLQSEWRIFHDLNACVGHVEIGSAVGIVDAYDEPAVGARHADRVDDGRGLCLSADRESSKANQTCCQ